jgi:hypothetical protein
MSTAPWAAHFGLARTPFGKRIAARDLFARQAHAEVRLGYAAVLAQPPRPITASQDEAGRTSTVPA